MLDCGGGFTNCCTSSQNNSGCSVVRSGYSFNNQVFGLGNFMLWMYMR